MADSAAHQQPPTRGKANSTAQFLWLKSEVGREVTKFPTVFFPQLLLRCEKRLRHAVDRIRQRRPPQLRPIHPPRREISTREYEGRRTFGQFDRSERKRSSSRKWWRRRLGGGPSKLLSSSRELVSEFGFAHASVREKAFTETLWGLIHCHNFTFFPRSRIWYVPDQTPCRFCVPQAPWSRLNLCEFQPSLRRDRSFTDASQKIEQNKKKNACSAPWMSGRGATGRTAAIPWDKRSVSSQRRGSFKSLH